MQIQHTSDGNWFRKALLLFMPVAILAGCTGSADVEQESSRQGHDRPMRGASISISPVEAYTFHELRVAEVNAASSLASLQGSLDVKERSQASFVWSVNGTDVSQGPVLDPQSFRRGDQVEVRLEHRTADGSVQVLDKASLKILNSPPSLPSVILRRDPAQPDQLEAIASATDPDGDPLTIEYQWMVDGTVQDGETMANISLASAHRGQQFVCRATAFDGEASSATMESTPFRLDNRPPRLDVRGQGTPLESTGDDDGRWVGVQIQVTDPDGDAVSVQLHDAPADVRWDAARSKLVWKLGEGVETFDVRVTATDGRGGSAERSVTLQR